jgi:signal transduction histidine kinase
MERELLPAIVWSFLDNLREGVLVVHPDGGVEYMNKAACLALGLDRDQDYETLDEILPVQVSAVTSRRLLNAPFQTHIMAANRLVELESHPWPAPDGPLRQIFVRPTTADSPLHYNQNSHKSTQVHPLFIESVRVKLLLQITSELSASLDHDWVLMRALEMVGDIVDASQGVILLIDQEKGELVFRASLGESRQLSPRGLSTGMMQNEGLAGWIITHRTPVIVQDTHRDPRWVERESSKAHRSVLAVPLISNEEVLGVLMLFQSRPNAFTNDQLDLVETAAVQVANAINNANLYRLIRQQAERLGKMLRLEQIESAKSQAILESIADGVIVADASHKIILANRPAAAILEIPRAQLLDTAVDDFLGLYGLESHAWIAAVDRWLHEKDGEQTDYLEVQLPIGNKVINVRVSPVLVGSQFFGTVSIFRDITKEVEVDRLKSEFVSTVSHELRTPMTSIKGYVDLMLMGVTGKLIPAQARYLRIIKNNAERLQTLVDDLLNISRIETGKLLLDLKPVDLAVLAQRVVDHHLNGRIQHEARQVTVKTELPRRLPLVMADEARITQVITNLLDNALNYSSNGGTIEISAVSEPNQICLHVTDSGIGIAEADLNRIFDRFYRADDTSVQSVPGTGLGLSIVRSIVEMHGGQMSVRSKLGHGSTFSFTLPLRTQSNLA